MIRHCIPAVVVEHNRSHSLARARPPVRVVDRHPWSEYSCALMHTYPHIHRDRPLPTRVNLSYGRILNTIKLLALESPAPIATLGGKWQLTAARLREAFWERTDRLTALRQAEQRQMQEYVDLSSGHMALLIRALDGDPGDFQSPDVPDLPAAVHPASVRDAIAFLRNASLAIVPRKKWPTGRWIEREHRAQAGRALCAWGNAGWSRLVSGGKYQDDQFGDELVDACANLVREWQPAPYPTWVAAVPSHRQDVRTANLRGAKNLGRGCR